VKVVGPTAYYQQFCSKSLYSAEYAIEIIPVTINPSFILLKHIFFSFFIRSHHNYLLFVLDLLDHQPWHVPSSHLLEYLG
jgi:hypothetical protein